MVCIVCYSVSKYFDFLFKNDEMFCSDWKRDNSIKNIYCDNDLFCLINQSLWNTSQLFPNLIWFITKLWLSMKFIHCRSDNEQRPPRKLPSSEEWEMPRAIRPPRTLPSSEEWEMPRAIRPPRKLPSSEEWEMPRAIRPPRKRSTSEEWEMPRAMTIEEFEIKQNKNKNKKKNKNI
jgi:hypothetical protein